MKKYLEKNRSRIFLMGLFIFLIHGAKIHSEVIGIDTEDLIHIQKDFYGGWQNTGRQGLLALKWIMASWNFQPYMAGLLTLIFFALSVSAFFLLWDNILWNKKISNKTLDTRHGENSGRGMFAWIAGGLFLISHPIITEQFYFTLQSVEICIGLLLTVFALYLILRYRENGKVWRLAAAFLCLLLTFSIYQAFVVLFIFGTVSLLLLRGISKLQSGEKTSAGELLKEIIPYLGVFLAAFIVNTLITKLFFSASDYLGGQILWGKFAVKDNLKAIAGHVFKALTGYESVHYHFSFGLLCIVAVCLVIRLCVQSGWKKGSVTVILFYLAALYCTPFLMTIVCGGSPVIRSQLVLPLATGFLAYLDVLLLSQCVKGESVMGKGVYFCVALICLVGIWGQTSTTMSLYYTDRMRYEQDAFLGREVITAIDRVREGEEYPVAVIGRRPFSGNHACVTGEIIGKSFFDHDVEVEPQYYWSTRRILGFLHTLGADYTQADRSRFGDAAYYSMDMPVWPAEGSVQIREGILIIKLSEIGVE